MCIIPTEIFSLTTIRRCLAKNELRVLIRKRKLKLKPTMISSVHVYTLPSVLCNDTTVLL